jgi:predicted Holliday junction resolvase-like endonuclease
MLSNIVFIIILILLVIILILLYFFSNDIRKNKNKINICESDINSMRERLLSMNQKITSLENDINNESLPKKSSKNNANFTDILEKLGSMNNNFFPMDGMMGQDDIE